MNAQEFLARLAEIPHLLEMAIQQDNLHRYQLQDGLRQQYRQQGCAFLYSMPMRHLYRCPTCGAQGTDILHELEDPGRGIKVEFLEPELHQMRAHAVPPEDELVDFFEGL